VSTENKIGAIFLDADGVLWKDIGPGGILSDLDSFDFSRASRSDMKRLVRTLINTLTLMLFVYLTAFFAIFCGLFLLALRKAENLASAHHDCLSYMRPHHANQHQL
jgi:hypothetical protein